MTQTKRDRTSTSLEPTTKPLLKSARPARATTKAIGQAPTKRRPKRFPAEVAAQIFSRFAHVTPEPKGELESVNAFTLLVAVVLSAQATDAGVNKATRALFAVAPTPQLMVALGLERLRDYIKTIGLFPTKAKNVIALSQKLVDLHGGEVPEEREALQALPGVGRKTANVVLNMAFGHETLAVDTHVMRVSQRIGFTRETTPDKVEADVVALIPPGYGLYAHHWVILHGRYLCKARRPECWRCPIADLCRYPAKTPAPEGDASPLPVTS